MLLFRVYVLPIVIAYCNMIIAIAYRYCLLLLLLPIAIAKQVGFGGWRSPPPICVDFFKLTLKIVKVIVFINVAMLCEKACEF